MKNMKSAPFGLVAVLALLAGLGGGLALGQRGGDEITNMETADSAEKAEGKPAAPPTIMDERTLYAGEKNVTSQHVVRAGRFELADGKGNIRAVFGLNPDGEPRLALADESGQIRGYAGFRVRLQVY